MKNLFLFAAVLLLIQGCTNNSVEPEVITDDVSYSAEIQPIFTNSCNNCHSAGQNNFNSSSYQAVMASTSPNYGGLQVRPGDADGSPLVDKIAESNPQHGSRMPTTGSLSQTQIAKIRAWIDQGAENN